MLRPPPILLLAYRFLGWRVGPRYRDWVHHDITTRGWLIRQGAPALSGVMVIGGVILSIVGSDGGKLETVIVVVALAGLGFRRQLRERALMQQGINEDGDQLPGLKWYDDDRLRNRRSLISASGTVFLTVTGMLILALNSR